MKVIGKTDNIKDREHIYIKMETNILDSSVKELRKGMDH
jgi:hypothetical protein